MNPARTHDRVLRPSQTSILRVPLGVVAGLAVTFAAVVGVEAFSAVVHPLPPDFDGSMQSMCDHVAR